MDSGFHRDVFREELGNSISVKLSPSAPAGVVKYEVLYWGSVNAG